MSQPEEAERKKERKKINEEGVDLAVRVGDDLKSRAQPSNVFVDGLSFQRPVPNQPVCSSLVHKGIQQIANFLPGSKLHLIIKAEVDDVDIDLEAVRGGDPNDAAFPSKVKFRPKLLNNALLAL